MLPHVLAWCDGYTWLYMVRHAHCLEDYPTCPWFGYVPIGLSHFQLGFNHVKRFKDLPLLSPSRVA